MNGRINQFLLSVFFLANIISVNAFGEVAGARPKSEGFETMSRLTKALDGQEHSASAADAAKPVASQAARPAEACSDKKSQELVEKYYRLNMSLIDRLRKLSLEARKAPGVKSSDPLIQQIDKEYSAALLEQALADKYVHGNAFDFIKNRALLAKMKPANDKRAPIADVIADLEKLKSQKVQGEPPYLTPGQVASFDAQLEDTIKFAKDQKPGDADALNKLIARVMAAKKNLTPEVATAGTAKSK